jgi:hypothetical protein
VTVMPQRPTFARVWNLVSDFRIAEHRQAG